MFSSAILVVESEILALVLEFQGSPPARTRVAWAVLHGTFHGP